MNGMCFWGEHFEFRDLPKRTERISLLIHKDKGNSGSGGSNFVVGNGVSNSGKRRKKAKKPVGRVRIAIPSVQSRWGRCISYVSKCGK